MNCFLLTIDYVPSIFETFRLRLMKKMCPVSFLSLETFCLLAIVSSTIIPLFVMVSNRVAKLLLDRDIPQFVEVDGCNCRVWYPRQPAQCSVCREFGHRVRDCPLSGPCCHQPCHMARECTQAWGPSLSVSRTAVPPEYSMEIEDEIPATYSDTSSSVSDEVPITTVTSPSVIITCSNAAASSPCPGTITFCFDCYFR